MLFVTGVGVHSFLPSSFCRNVAMRKLILILSVLALSLGSFGLFFHQGPRIAAEYAVSKPVKVEEPNPREMATRVAEVVLHTHFEITSVIEVVEGEQTLHHEDVSGVFGDVELRVDVERERALAYVTNEEGEYEFLLLLKRQPKKEKKRKSYAV